jgi:hypothetical protein
MMKEQRRENKAKKLQSFRLYCEDCGIPLGKQTNSITRVSVPFCQPCWNVRASQPLVQAVR